MQLLVNYTRIYIIFQAESINVEQRKTIQDLNDKLQNGQVRTHKWITHSRALACFFISVFIRVLRKTFVLYVIFWTSVLYAFWIAQDKNSELEKEAKLKAEELAMVSELFRFIYLIDFRHTTRFLCCPVFTLFIKVEHAV